MRDVYFFACACIFSGLLRVIASFIDYENAPEIIEVFYMVIDLGLILGLIGFYIMHRSTLSSIGKAGIVISICGFAIISGPETSLFNIGIYQIGSPIIGIGVTLMCIDLISRNIGSKWPPNLLLSSIILGFAAMALSSQSVFILTGVIFGLGFALLGVQQLQHLKTTPEN